MVAGGGTERALVGRVFTIECVSLPMVFITRANELVHEGETCTTECGFCCWLVRAVRGTPVPFHQLARRYELHLPVTAWIGRLLYMDGQRQRSSFSALLCESRLFTPWSGLDRVPSAAWSSPSQRLLATGDATRGG